MFTCKLKKQTSKIVADTDFNVVSSQLLKKKNTLRRRAKNSKNREKYTGKNNTNTKHIQLLCLFNAIAVNIVLL